MILIDCLYINSFGGNTILELFIKHTLKAKIKFHFILDSRLDSKSFKTIKPNNYSLIKISHKNRINFYTQNIHRFSSILCLSNVPPPKLTKVKTTIFFHNRLLLNPFNHEISFKDRLFNFFKISYIKYYNQKDYNWVVQTPFMHKILQDNLKINSNKIYIYTVFKEESVSYIPKKITNNFVYVSSGVSHKNHVRLIKAFIAAAIKTNNEIKLHLTINKEELFKKIYPNNLKIKFHGTLSIDRVNRLYDSSEFAIYPSLVESFGLPLIEAANHGCKVIASDLPYVHEIIKPSLTFDPYSVESIYNAILNVIDTDDLPKTKVLVENKLDNFIEFIISQDVQK